MKQTLAAALLLLASIRPANATVDLSRVDLTPLLRVTWTKLIPVSINPPSASTEDEDLFVSRSGAATVVLVDFTERFGYQTTLVRSISPKSDFDVLKTALSKRRRSLRQVDRGEAVFQGHRRSSFGAGGRVVVRGEP